MIGYVEIGENQWLHKDCKKGAPAFVEVLPPTMDFYDIDISLEDYDEE